MLGNAVSCVKGEVHNVVSMLRLSGRWGSSSRFEREVPLEVSCARLGARSAAPVLAQLPAHAERIAQIGVPVSAKACGLFLAAHLAGRTDVPPRLGFSSTSLPSHVPRPDAAG